MWARATTHHRSAKPAATNLLASTPTSTPLPRCCGLPNIEPSLRARGGCIQRSIYGANVSGQTRDMASVTYIRKDDSPEPVKSSSGRTRNPCIDTRRTVLDRIQVSATAGGAKPLSFLRIEKPCDVPTQPRSSYSAQSRRGHLHIVQLVRVRLPPKRRCLAEEY